MSVVLFSTICLFYFLVFLYISSKTNDHLFLKSKLDLVIYFSGMILIIVHFKNSKMIILLSSSIFAIGYIH